MLRNKIESRSLQLAQIFLRFLCSAQNVIAINFVNTLSYALRRYIWLYVYSNVLKFAYALISTYEPTYTPHWMTECRGSALTNWMGWLGAYVTYAIHQAYPFSLKNRMDFFSQVYGFSRIYNNKMWNHEHILRWQ